MDSRKNKIVINFTRLVNIEAYQSLIQKCNSKKITLIAVSKTKPVEDILELYNLGQRDFGENYVQELLDKEKQLPKDIRWHFIGHLQSNKVKQIVSFIHLIHSVDSLKLLKEINKQSKTINENINCLLQIHIAQEETKFGLNEDEVKELLSQVINQSLKNISITGLMGMASFTEDKSLVHKEFQQLRYLFDKLATQRTINFKPETLSMGMTADYKIAIEEGSNMIRLGSLIFGSRN